MSSRAALDHVRATTRLSGSIVAGPPPERAPSTSRPIVLATEFGAVSTAAEAVAIRSAVVADVPLVIVHAIDPGRLRLPGGVFRARIDQVRSVRERDAEEIARRAIAAGARPQILIWTGDPATCVLEAARAENASRIVVGSHGRGMLGRALVGSVSADVAAGAPCPVLIVRGNAHHQEVEVVAPAGRSRC